MIWSTTDLTVAFWHLISLRQLLCYCLNTHAGKERKLLTKQLIFSFGTCWNKIVFDKFCPCSHNPAALVCMFEMFLCPTKECQAFEWVQWFLQYSVHPGLKWERGTLSMGHDPNEQPADWDQLDDRAHYDLSRVAWRGEPWGLRPKLSCWDKVSLVDGLMLKRDLKYENKNPCLHLPSLLFNSKILWPFTPMIPCANVLVSMYCAEQERKYVAHLV